MEFDVVIVGAGLSGIGAAVRLKTECPGKSFAVLEARDAIGGTWDLFRYPGVRSDSDMFTFVYPFRPWTGKKALGDGASILKYIRDTATEYGIDAHIRFRHKIVRASWSSVDARWSLELEVGEGRKRERCSCRFLYLCSGYYNYEKGHAPEFPGVERFSGKVVHPQFWPENLDYAGKRIVVIGSGATAVTLVPALAERASHVTMLQRSPSYILSMPATDSMADTVRGALPSRIAHHAIRAKNVLLALAFYQVCRRFPALASRLLRRQVAAHLPEDYDVATHFTPRYDPWDQRVCLVPDADLFRALSRGRASVVTDQIETFTEEGVRLVSGRELQANIVVTATGLELLPCGNIRLDVDGQTVELKDRLFYKGLMLSGVPNLAWCIGYTNSSWGLRADLSSRYVCRLLDWMGQNGHDSVVAHASPDGERRPVLDLSSGYIQRALDELPRQGDRAPWYVRQNYLLDLMTMVMGRIDDGVLSFARRPTESRAGLHVLGSPSSRRRTLGGADPSD